MKTRTLAVFLILSVFFCCYSGVYANAQEFFYHTSYVEEHIDWIQVDTTFDENVTEDDNPVSSHYPENLVGSCGYVALSLLLSFYDVYWRDEFVPDCYYDDYDGPYGCIDDVTGEIWREMHFAIENTAWDAFWYGYWKEYKEINDLEENTAETEAIKETVKLDVYKQFVIDHSNDYFHFYLMSLGRTLGYYDGTDYGIDEQQLAVLLNHYLTAICHINSTKVQVNILTEDENTSREMIYEKIKEKVQQGFPVLYTGNDYIDNNSRANSSVEAPKKGGHVLLAYKMTKEGNNIVLTPCWNGGKLETFYTTKYKYNSSIIWLEITEDFKHECSTSYKYMSKSEDGYCVCDIFSEHPNHVHEYEANAHDEISHWKKCLCGESQEKEYHQLVFKHNVGTQHYYKCEKDGCGYYVLKHSLIYTATLGDLHRVSCEDCDYVTLDFHDFYPSENPRYSKCYYCGYTRDEWGSGSGNVIMGKKEDEETE